MTDLEKYLENVAKVGVCGMLRTSLNVSMARMRIHKKKLGGVSV